MDCKLAKAMKHPSIVENSDFWVEFGKINTNNSYELEKLIKKYSPEALSDVDTNKRTAGNLSTNEVFTMSSKAEKAKAKLSVINQKHFDEFIQLITEKGPHALYERPAKWHYEELKGSSAEKPEHTVRLDKGYRVKFTIDDGVVRILDIGNHIGH